MRCPYRFAMLALVGAMAQPATTHAQEVFAGAYVHAVDTPLTFYTGEDGVDIAAGYRFTSIESLGAIGKPAPYVIASVNTSGDTSFAGAGLSWTIGTQRIYLRPAVGLVVHDGPASRYDPMRERQTDLGSRVLFEPEVGLGYRVTDRLAIEASWMHISHARLFNSKQNPGIDMMGLRLAWRMP